jgi:HSP20 family protein
MYLNLYRPNSLHTVNPAAFGDAVDRLFGEITHSRVSRRPAGEAVRQARFDLIEHADRFEALVELPGVAKEDIEVSLDGTTVSVSAKAKTERTATEGERVLYTERSASSYARRFELPSEVVEAGVTARFENGVLTLVLPKKEEVKARRIEVQ